MNVKDIFRKETGEHIEIEKEFNEGVFVDVYNENYIAWLESKVNVTLGSVSKKACDNCDTIDDFKAIDICNSCGKESC